MPLRLFAVVLLLIGQAAIAAAAPSPERIDKSIQRGKAWLYSKQNAQSNWEIVPARDPAKEPWTEGGAQWGGLTALAVYSLLSAGESHNDPRLVKAIDFLKSADVNGTYALSMRVQVWSKLPQNQETKQLIRKDLQKLLATMNSDAADKGQHDYLEPPKGYSHSRSNYAILGIWTAAQCDVEVPDNYWKIAAESWIANQDASGGWTYKAPGKTEHPVTPGMTAAGVATLFIAQDYLYPDGNIKSPAYRSAVDRGMKWLGDNFSKVATEEKYDRDFPFPTVFSIERVGLASGRRYIGEVDWYEKASAWLVDKQLNSGGWHRTNAERGSLMLQTSDTAFALITLARGRSPVAFSKLDYSTERASTPGQSERAVSASSSPDWNARPRDIANVCRYITRQAEREVNWHIVTLKSPLNHWHESPVLYMAGSKPPALSADDKAKLKRFVEEGGLILASADGSSKLYGDWFKKFGAEIFPAREWRELPQDHPLYTSQQFPRTAWRNKPSVIGLSNGVRELMILLPLGDPGRWWQSGNTGTKEELWQLGANIHQYAAGRENLRLRGQSHAIERDPKITPTRTIKLARLQYAGNWDPEPGGWQRISNLIHNRDKIDLQIEPKKLVESLEGFKIAHLTGTDALKLDAAATESLKKFIDAGGTLLVDSAGGSSAFASAIETSLNELLPDVKLAPLPPEHAILVGDDKKKLPIAYRPFSRKTIGSLTGDARLQALMINDRAAVIYSREDVSNGLVGANTDGITGYEPSTATEIVRRIVVTGD